MDGTLARVAERTLPLAQGSNFRDLGGYAAAGGKHVRWGVLFRSGATPLLTEADVHTVGELGLKNLVDLRSDEERVIAPTRIDGVRYTAVGYPMAAQMDFANPPPSMAQASDLYRKFPTLLAPQLRIIFHELLAGDAPLVYNCSAGQDRTGFVTAILLSALGVPQDVILTDYHLSVQYRRPEYEMPKINPAAFPGNAVAAFYAKAQTSAMSMSPQPLYDADHRALLEYALDEVQKRWGSVQNYLAQEIGVTEADIAKLRQTYLE
jgi:protein-tyrosine phosphatase